MSIFIQSYVNIKLHVSTLLGTDHLTWRRGLWSISKKTTIFALISWEEQRLNCFWSEKRCQNSTFTLGSKKSVLLSSFNTYLVMWKYNYEPLWFLLYMKNLQTKIEIYCCLFKRVCIYILTNIQYNMFSINRYIVPTTSIWNHW